MAGERVLDLGTGSIAIRVAALVDDGGYVTGGDYTVTICTQ